MDKNNEEYQALLKFRYDLVTKEFDIGLTDEEARDLNLVQCQLDLIEYVDFSHLENIIEAQEKLGKKIHEFLEKVKK